MLIDQDAILAEYKALREEYSHPLDYTPGSSHVYCESLVVMHAEVEIQRVLQAAFAQELAASISK